MNWISVKDRLPNKGQRVLAGDWHDNFPFVTFLFYEGLIDGQPSWSCPDGSLYHPTHWMKIPGSPYEVDQCQKEIS